MKLKRTLEERFAAGGVAIGFLLSRADPTFTEIAGLCGYDFLMLDGEHGAFSDTDLLHTLRVLASTDTLAMVRILGHDTHTIGRYLDMGADIIAVPNVCTAEESKALARAMVYPPAGTRGFGASLHRSTG